MQLAKECAEKNGPDDRTAHVGYFLIGHGMLQTEKRAKVRLSV